MIITLIILTIPLALFALFCMGLNSHDRSRHPFFDAKLRK